MKIKVSEGKSDTIAVSDTPVGRWFWIAEFNRYGFKVQTGEVVWFWNKPLGGSPLIERVSAVQTSTERVELLPAGFSITLTNE